MPTENTRKFKEVLAFVFDSERSDFYRAKYQRSGFNPHTDFNSLDDIAKVPLVTKAELVEAGDDKLLFIPEEEVRSIASTSGTTGKPLLIRYSHTQPTSDILEEQTPGAVLLLNNPFLAGRMYARYAEVHTKGPSINGDIHNLGTSCAIAARAKVALITTTPTIAILMKKFVTQYPELERSFKYLRLGSELVTPAKKKFLRELYPGVEIYIVYTSSEGERTGFQCPYLAAEDETSYHLHMRNGTQETTNHLEIIDPDTGGILPFGERGELVQTHLYNFATPLIRYRTGDIANFAENNCPCGAPGPLLRTWGRANHDMVRAGGFELRRDMFEAPLMSLQGYLADGFEVRVREQFVGSAVTVQITLLLSLREGVQRSPFLEKKIAETFLRETRISPNFTLGQAVEGGAFDPIGITYTEFPSLAKAHAKILLE